MTKRQFTETERNSIELFLTESTHDNLNKLLGAHGGEHNSVDFKQEIGNKPSELAKDLIALGNSEGGLILF